MRIARRPAAAARQTRGLVLACAAAVLLAACGGNAAADQGRTGAPANYVAGAGTVSTLAPANRAAPVSFTGTMLTGEPFDVASLRGKVAVLNVWGSWCPPCREEAPQLQRAWSTSLQPRGVLLLGLDTREGPQTALAWMRSQKLTYPSLQDDGGRALLALRGQLPPNAVPSTLVLDKQGRVAARVLGKLDATTLIGLVDDVLAGK